jgi:putative transposase
VTICVQDRECLSGAVVDGEMVCNAAGRMVQRVWDELSRHYPGVENDAFVAMPNHVHGIIILTRTGQPPGAGQPRGTGQPRGAGQPRGVAPTAPRIVGAGPCACPGRPGSQLSLPDVVHRFKSYTTAQYRHGVYEHGWSSFPQRLWQRNDWDHVIRNDASLGRIREYIEHNAARWENDRLHPDEAPNRFSQASAKRRAS